MALRVAALHAVELITVGWPAAGARASTVDQLDELAIEALAGTGERDPAAAPETAEWLEQIGSEPDDLLELALREHRRLQRSGGEELGAGLRLIVSCCAEINRKLAPDEHQPPQAARAAAELIDGAGFAGGALIDVGLLLDALYDSLVGSVGAIGRARVRPQAHPTSTLAWPAEAMRTALILGGPTRPA